jgi:hypothetical protein
MIQLLPFEIAGMKVLTDENLQEDALPENLLVEVIQAKKALHRWRIRAELVIITRNQVLALPGFMWDLRHVAVIDRVGREFSPDRPPAPQSNIGKLEDRMNWTCPNPDCAYSRGDHVLQTSDGAMGRIVEEEGGRHFVQCATEAEYLTHENKLRKDIK